jgi:phage-related protein
MACPLARTSFSIQEAYLFMNHKGPAIQYWFATLALSALISVAPARAQSPNTMPQDRDADLTRQQLAAFDQFLDKHSELSEQLRKDPSLVNNDQFVASHPDLQTYLQQHPEVREDLNQNPNAVMHQEQRFDRREDRNGDRDITRGELGNMDRFMDSHPEIAEQLRKNPALVDNKEFVTNHPALQEFLASHPGVREEMKENPNAFMHREERFDQREDRRDRDVTRGELANMDHFMDSHPEIAEQLRKNPSLVDNKEFVQGHPALQEFLTSHPGVREEYKENPSGFMRQEQRFDRAEDSNMRGDRDVTRGELANMDRFMDSHPEIAEQLRKNPSLVDNKEFVQGHPPLQEFLASHPVVREEYKENPSGFMRQEQRFDRAEDNGMRRDHDVTRGELSSFHEFLEGHSNIAGELSKNPGLATNQEYLENHPALKTYLRANPKVHEELGENPQSFVKSAQQFQSPSKGMPSAMAEPKVK